MEAPVGWQARSPPGSAGGGSWEDKRSRNMQRNQQYLAQLFADGSLDDMSASGSGNASKPGAAPGDCKTAEGVLRALQSKLRDIWAPRVASCDDVLMEVCAHCPCREVQARRLIGYISESFHPLPPLLVSGPSGCGKSLIASRALAAADAFHVHVLCSAFASHGQLIRGTWMAFIKALIRRVACSSQNQGQGRCNEVSSTLQQLGPLDGKPVFSTLAEAIRETITKFGISDVVFCFDNFDAVDRLEHSSIDGNTYVKLLNMNELVHESVRVIAIQRRSNRTSASAAVNSGSFVLPGALSLRFEPYSDVELLKVVEAHARSELGEQSLEFGVFLEYLKDSISQIRMTSNHPEEIFNAARLIMKVKLEHQSETTPSATIASASTRAIADQVVRVPCVRPTGQALDAVLETAGSSRAAVSFGDSMNNDPYLASKNPKESDKFTFGDSRRGRRKRVREGQDGDDGAGGSGGGGTEGGAATHLSHAPQSFTLDRVLAIYRHIYCTHEDANINVRSHGSASGGASSRGLDLDGGNGLFAMISTLERSHWIAASSGWRADQPSYYFLRSDAESAISQLARSVHLPLQSYLAATAVPLGLNA